MTQTLIHIVLLFGGLSLLSIGGGNSIIPDMQRAAVEIHHWMTDREFLDLFAISRVTPGPGSLIVALVGQKAGGVAGACAAIVGMYIPSCSLMYLTTCLWENGQNATWRPIAEKTLAPLGIGLIFAGGAVLMQNNHSSFTVYLITAVSTLVLTIWTINPLWILLSGAIVGIAVDL